MTDSGLIFFTIDGRTYTAEAGMTWEEWCNSAYNSAQFRCEHDLIMNPDGSYIYESESLFDARPTDPISPNGVYVT